jgi:hypothetical protein
MDFRPLGVEIGEGGGVFFFCAFGILKYLSPLYSVIYCSEKYQEEQERYGRGVSRKEIYFYLVLSAFTSP